MKNVSVLITKNEVNGKSDLEINLTKSLKLKDYNSKFESEILSINDIF